MGTVDLVFCPVTSIQGVPGLVTLLILVLLGKHLVTLDDVGALGFASSLYSENLKDIYKTLFILNTTLDFTAFLALMSGFSACHFLLFRIVSGTAGSLPTTAILVSENYTDDIRIVGDEVTTGLQNKAHLPDQPVQHVLLYISVKAAPGKLLSALPSV